MTSEINLYFSLTSSTYSHMPVVKVIGPRNPKDKDAINTTSISNNWSCGLSPFHLGPVHLYGGLVSLNMENAWQYAKLYPEHADKNGNPTDAYWEWAKNGWGMKKAVRYPMGKGRSPICSLWDTQKLTYVEARKKIYIPLYVKSVVFTEAYVTLCTEALLKFSNGEDVVLWDFDGYNHIEEGMTFDEVANCPNRKMGHAFVLAMMLERHPLVVPYMATSKESV